MNLEKWPKYQNPDDPDPVVTVRCKPTEGNGGDTDEPILAVIWRANHITLLRSTTDDSTGEF